MGFARSIPGLRRAAIGQGARAGQSRTTPRRALLWVLVAFSVLLVHEMFVTDTMHRQRQRQLASEFSAQATSPTIGRGHAVAVLQIPKLGLNQVVARGDTSAVLRGGPGLASSSLVPGSGGNAVIVGKASRYGASFANIGRLQPDDRIFVQVKGGQTLEYAVREVNVLPGSDSSFGAPSVEQLTLVASAGGWLSRSRQVVVATPVSESGTASSTGAVTLSERVGLDDLAVILVWIGAAVLIAALALRVRRHLPRLIQIVVNGPIVALVLLQLLVALERLLPATR